jgi:hypothetical protein
MKCVLCGRRKGKRYCPAKNDSICAQCCGEKRILEIDCPDSCEYLRVGRNRETDEYTRFVRNMHGRREMHERVLRENQGVVAHLEYMLAQERRSTRDLRDKEVAEALDLLLESRRTEDKGILYEKTADDLRVESLRRMMRDVIESHRNPDPERREGLVGPQNKRLTLAAAIDCLEFVHDLIASHMSAGKNPSSYVDLLARIIPRELPGGGARGSIIIP